MANKKQTSEHPHQKVRNLLTAAIIVGFGVLGVVAIQSPELFRAQVGGAAFQAPSSSLSDDAVSPITVECPDELHTGANSVDVEFTVDGGSGDYKLVVNSEEQFGSYSDNESFDITFNTSDQENEVMFIDNVDGRSSNTCKFSVVEQ